MGDGAKRMSVAEYQAAVKALDDQLTAAEKSAQERSAAVVAERNQTIRELTRVATDKVREEDAAAKAAVRAAESSARDRIRELEAQLAEAKSALERVVSASRAARDEAGQAAHAQLNAACQDAEEKAELELLQIQEDLDTTRHVVGQARIALKEREPRPKAKQTAIPARPATTIRLQQERKFRFPAARR